MDKMTQILDIPSIKNDTNFWMVRAKRGFFFDEFIRNEFIAIGWNSVTKAMISQNLTRSQSDRLKASIKATYDESKPGTSLNKCIRFCYELKAGDIAVIVDNNRVAFAYIGEYYEEQSPTLTVELEKEVHQQIEKANPNTDTFTCPYIKRRKITLIKVLTADDTISPYWAEKIPISLDIPTLLRMSQLDLARTLTESIVKNGYFQDIATGRNAAFTTGRSSWGLLYLIFA